VIDSQTQGILQAVLDRESRSMLLYTGEAYPWATLEEEKALRALQQLIAEEREAIGRLGRFLVRRHIPLPPLGFFPQQFTTINFLALDYLIPRLIEAQRRSIAELERDLAGLHDSDARTAVADLLAVKRRHLEVLEDLVRPQLQASAT
jgi:hypothetical protein